jgi:hypothetical protein
MCSFKINLRHYNNQRKITKDNKMKANVKTVKEIKKENMELIMIKLSAILCDVTNGRIAKLTDKDLVERFGATQKEMFEQIVEIENLIKGQ